jgi:hypothetical protein
MTGVYGEDAKMKNLSEAGAKKPVTRGDRPKENEGGPQAPGCFVAAAALMAARSSERMASGCFSISAWQI